MKITSNALVTLVRAEQDCFKELFEAVDIARRISEFIWQCMECSGIRSIISKKFVLCCTIPADFQLMRCIAKIAEVVYPKLEMRPLVPLTPRRRTQSISAPYNFPSPVPSSEDSDDDSNDNKSDSEAVEHQKASEDDRHGDNVKSPDLSDEHSSQCGSSAETPTSEPSSTKPADSTTHTEADKYSSVVTKMLFEILQNLLADILTILEKVTQRCD